MDITERRIYALVCQNDGIKAKEIAHSLQKERAIINQYLYSSPYMKELCYKDNNYQWHGLIRQTIPHRGLEEFGGYYSTIKEFLKLGEEAWFQQLLLGCRQIGRNLNDTRGLFHSFKDTANVIRGLCKDLEQVSYEDWEILFELRIKKSKFIRIYADVLMITNRQVFALEFKMNHKIETEDMVQAAKYVPYLEIIFGADYDIIPVLVLTRATDLFTYQTLPDSTAEIPVCSGDMLFNIVDEYIGFLQ